MSREASIVAALVAAVLGGVIVLVVAFVGVRTDEPRPSDARPGPTDEPASARISERLDALADQVETLTREARQAADRNAARIQALGDRLEAIESRAPDVSRASHPAARTGSADAASDAERRAAELAEFKELLDSGILGSFSLDEGSEDLQRFWELARSTGVLDDLIGDLESGVELDPGDIAARLELAEAYVAKLLTVPTGPERGLWAVKAEKQWTEVLAADPDQWEAQFSIAMSHSQYPDFLNKTGEAIQGMKRAREIQERLPAAEAHAQTYLALSRLYLKTGRSDLAREALESGLARHPDDTELAAALRQM